MKCTLLLAPMLIVCVLHSPVTAQPPRRTGNEVFSGPPETDPVLDRKWARSWGLTKQGNEMLQQKRYKEAQALFEQAIKELKYNQAEYGLAQCYLAAGDRNKAIDYYRSALYYRKQTNSFVALLNHEEDTTPITSENIGGVSGPESQGFALALLLSQTGQSDEAVYVYNTVLSRFNYCDGKQSLKVLLPEFGLKAGQRTYRIDFFQAMVHIALALTTNEDTPRMEHLREAVRLSPSSGVAHFYLAERLVRSSTTRSAAKAEYIKARVLDPQAAGKAADAELDSFLFRNVTPENASRWRDGFASLSACNRDCHW